MQSQFKEIDHTGDLAIRVWGEDLPDLFGNAAYAMACQLTDVPSVDLEFEAEVEVGIHGEDFEMLLVEWLSELLYLVERDGVVFTQFSLRELTASHLRAIVRGAPVDEIYIHIKAVTFSELNIRETHERYETVVVFDV